MYMSFACIPKYVLRMHRIIYNRESLRNQRLLGFIKIDEVSIKVHYMVLSVQCRQVNMGCVCEVLRLIYAR